MAISKFSLLLAATLALLAIVVGCRVNLSLGGIGRQTAEARQEVAQTLEFPAQGHIFINNCNGRIMVTGWDRDEIEVKAEKIVRIKSNREPGDEKMQAWLDKIQIDIDRSGAGRVNIETRGPNLSMGSQYSVNYSVRVPACATLELKTSNGNVAVAGIKGHVIASTSNGTINLREVAGRTDLHTSNGKIECIAQAGPVAARTSNGKINVHFAQAPLPAEGIECHTSNGKIDLRLPESCSFTLDARTSNGALNCDCPLTIQGRVNKHNIQGTVNGGGPQVKLRTSNGSIRVGTI